MIEAYRPIQPSAPVVTLPSGVYSNITQIAYTNSSVSNPSYMRLVYYFIELLDVNFNFVTSIGNNSLLLANAWNDTNVSDGKYIVKVSVFDNFTQTNFGLSQQFVIDKTAAVCSDLSISSQTAFDNATVTARITDSGLNTVKFFTNNTVSYNQTFNASLIDVYNASANFIVANATQVYGFEMTDYTGITSRCTGNFTATEPETPTTPVFTIGGCPDTLVSVLIIGICVLIALFFIALGYIMQNLYLPIFGWIFLIIVSWYLLGCIGLYASIMMIVSILMILLTVVMIKNKDYG